jgi:hypothetical protein
MGNSTSATTRPDLARKWRLSLPFLPRKSSAMNQDHSSSWQRRLQALLDVQLARFPWIIQLRATLRLLREERRDWPWLLPLLVVVFVSTYRGERARRRLS